MNNTIPKTELFFKESDPIDKLGLFDSMTLMIEEQKKAVFEVRKSIKPIGQAINKIINHLNLNNSSRIIYTGAGTSGRIGLQDGVELYPTFNWPKQRLDFIIAGGKDAVFNSIENAEDDIMSAIDRVKEISVNSFDVVIGLAASGNTPFTCKVLEEAKNKKALTISISNNPKGNILKFGKIKIVLDTKEEVIAGSTRLKAGTAQKICLNLISSIVMTRMGFVKNGEMINLVPTNQKLVDRKIRINKKKSLWEKK